MEYNKRMEALYKKNYTINPVQKALRFNNPFLIASSQVLLSNILKAQTNPPSLQQTATKMAETASNIETSKKSSAVESEKTKITKRAKIASDKAKADAKTASDKAKADAKAASDKANADAIRSKFNKSVADLEAELKAKKDAKEKADYLKRDEAERVREEKEEAKKGKTTSESGGIKRNEGKTTSAPKKKVPANEKPIVPAKKPVVPTKKPVVPPKKEAKTPLAKETDSDDELNKIKNNQSLPKLNRDRAGYILNKNKAKASLKLLNDMNDPISNPPPYQPYLTADGERQEPGSQMERESDAYRIWFKQYGKQWIKREQAKQTFRDEIQKEDALLKGNSQSLVQKSSANTSKYFPNRSETHIPVIKNEIARLKRVVGENPGDLPAKLALKDANAVLVKLNKEKSDTAKVYIKAVKDRNKYAVQNGVSSAEFKEKAMLVEALITKLHSYDKLTPSTATTSKDHKLPDPFGKKQGTTTDLPVAGGSALRGGGN